MVIKMKKRKLHTLLAVITAITLVITNLLQTSSIAYAAVSNSQQQTEKWNEQSNESSNSSEEIKQPLEIQHDVPESFIAYENQQITATIPTATKATLYYQPTPFSKPVAVMMNKEENNTFTTSIPATSLWSEKINYWIVADNGQTQQTSNTFTVPIKKESKADSQAAPHLMITEVNLGNEPFIEVYNNTTEAVPLKDYSLLIQGKKIEFNDSPLIPAGKTKIIRFTNKANHVETFNHHYNTNLKSEQFIMVGHVTISAKDSTIKFIKQEENKEISEITYNYHEASASQLFYFHNNQMNDGGVAETATPGTLIHGQIPDQQVEIEVPQETPQDNSKQEKTANSTKPVQEKKNKNSTNKAETANEESIIKHEPVEQISNANDLTIRATASHVKNLTLKYKTGKQMMTQELSFIKMEGTDTFTVTVPKQYLWSPSFSYQIVAETMDGGTIVYPKENDIHVTVDQVTNMDTQKLPKLLITEITPDTTNVNKADGYEFIEIYNNSNQSINMKDYQLFYRYPDGTADQVWKLSDNKVIEPQESFIVWIKNFGNQDKTLADFNQQYGLNLPESHVTEIYNDGMANGNQRNLVVADKFNNEIVQATYNDTATDDTLPDQGIVYSYPREGTKMLKVGIGETITPLTIVPGQAPEKTVKIEDENAAKPVIKNPAVTVDNDQITINVNISSKQKLLGATISISQSDKADYQTWQLEPSKDDPTIYSVTIPRDAIWSDKINFYLTASNEAGETKTKVQEYNFPVENIDYQKVPPLLITELVPDTTNSNGADAYEFIEVYNNSTEPINFKDYSIRYRYPNTGAGNDLIWDPKDDQEVMVDPGETIVFWIINHANTDKTAADFNANFKTNLIEGKNLFKIYNTSMANSGQRTLIIATKTGKELSYASYNDEVDVDDTAANKGIFYRYPTDGGLYSKKISAGKSPATPGSVLTEQVPAEKVNLPKDTEKPVIKHTTNNKEITLDEPVTLSATITDNLDVKSVSVYYRTDKTADFKKVNLETQADHKYEHIVYEPEFIGKRELEYYFVASDGRNESISNSSTINIKTSTIQEGLRLNVSNNELLSGEKVMKATTDDGKTAPKLFIDNNEATNTFKAMESEAYFAFDVKDTNIYFQNGVTMGDEILRIFDDTHTKFTTLTVPIPADKLKQNENTITIRAGNKVGPFDETSQENRDDFTIKNIRLVLSDGTTIYDPKYSDPNQDYSIGDSPGKNAVYDFTFNLGEEEFASTAYLFDTTKVPDGKHHIKAVSDNEEVAATVITDNTKPIILPSIKDGETYKGEFIINAEAKDETSEVTSLTAQLDGEYISLPYQTSSALLKPGKHELVYQATDAANNTVEKKVTFHVVEEHPFLPDWLANDPDSTSANLSVTVKDPTNDEMNVDFYQAYQYTAADKNITISQNAVDTEPPKGYLPEGEERITDDRRNQLQVRDGNKLETESDYQFPYHRFDVTVDQQVDENDEIEIVWNGSSLEGRKVTMYAWNYQTSKWDALITTIAGKEDFELVGTVQGQEYVQDQKISVIVQDQIAAIGEEFSFVWMSDTQYYTESYPYIYEKQTEWIVKNREKLNIEYVFHTGDIVNVYNDLNQWNVADKAMKTLDDAGVPYGVLAGNHDVNNKDHDYSYYSRFFGEDRFKNNDYYGGSFQNNRGHYDLMSVNGIDFIMIYLGWGIEEEGIAWVNQVLEAHPNRKAILNVHEYLLATGNRSPIGDQLFEKVVVPNENVFAVLSGHYHNAQTLVDDIDDNGDGIADRTVYQMLADYQGGPEGGQGYLRILNFKMKDNQVYVQTYSPYLDDYNYYDPTEYPGKDEFSFEFDTAAQTKKVATDYIEVNVYTDEKIGTVNNVPSGKKASVIWNDLDPNHEYFWYTIATDKFGGKTRSSIWNFLTVDGEIIEPENPEKPENPEDDGQPGGGTNDGKNEQDNSTGRDGGQGSTGSDQDSNNNEKPSMEQPAADNGINQSKPNQTRDDSQAPIIENTSNHNGTGSSSLPNTATNIFNWMLTGTLLLLLGTSVWLNQSYRKKTTYSLRNKS